MNGKTLDMDFQELIVRYLAGEADLEEQRLLLKWLKENPDHVKTFNSIRHVSDTYKHLGAKQTDFHLDAALADFDKKTKMSTGKVYMRPQSRAKQAIWALGAIAAVGLILVIFTFVSNKSANKANIMLAQATDSVCHVVLRDGTHAELGKNSRIFVAKNFDNNHRVLSLQGEALFRVKHDKNHPFVIQANGVTITDIGTAFKVNTDSITKSSSIVVTEGVVKVDYYGQVSILHAGDYAKTNVSKKQLIVGRKAVEAKPGAKNVLVFENTPMAEVVAKLNEHYQTNFVIASSSLKSYKLNASFDNNTTIEQVKDLLSIVLNVDIKNTGGKLLIYSHSD